MNVLPEPLGVQERTPTWLPVSTGVAGSPVSVQTGDDQVFGSGSSSDDETNTSTTVLLPVPVIRAPNQSPFCTELESVHASGRSPNASSNAYSHFTSEPETWTS
jgi:hypothetical protein